MLDCKPSTTSIIENHHLQVYPDQIPPIKEQYEISWEAYSFISHPA